MIGLFKVKEKQREQAQNASRGGGGASVKKQSAGELRLHKGLSLYIPLIVLAFCLFFKFQFLQSLNVCRYIRVESS